MELAIWVGLIGIQIQLIFISYRLIDIANAIREKE